MDCDLKLNQSIREKLEKELIFPWLSRGAICSFAWAHWDNFVLDLESSVAKERGSEIQKVCSPTELRYIHKNILEKAWDKLGLKLVEEKLEYEIPELDEKERGQLESIIQKIESGAASCSSEICRAGNICSKIFMTHRETLRRCYFCAKSPDKEQVLAALKDVLSKQPKKPSVPYAAVRMANFETVPGDVTGKVYRINQQSGNMIIDNKHKTHFAENIQRITNQSDACEILMELEGKQDIVEAIKEWAHKEKADAQGYVLRVFAGALLGFINDLESKAGKENSS